MNSGIITDLSPSQMKESELEDVRSEEFDLSQFESPDLQGAN